MQPLLVIDPSMKMPMEARLLSIQVLLRLDFFGLQRFHKTLRFGIVIGIAFAAHAQDELHLLQALHILAGAVLTAAIGIMHRATLDYPVGECTFGRAERQFGVQTAIYLPSHHAA
jgi:hypothetical protein